MQLYDTLAAGYQTALLSREFADRAIEREYRAFRARQDAWQVLYSSGAFCILYGIGFLLDWSLDSDERSTNLFVSRMIGILVTVLIGVSAIYNPRPWKNDLGLVLLNLTFALAYSYAAYYYTTRVDLAQNYLVYGIFIFVVWMNVCASVRACFWASSAIVFCASANHIFFIQSPPNVTIGYMGIWLFALIAGYLTGRNLQFVPRRDYAMMKSLETEIEHRREIEEELHVYQNELEALVSRKTDELHEREQQLLHAQRMESIGQLAGGIAHDFNNLLMVVLGYAGLARSSEDIQAIRRYQEEIEQAGQRGVELSKQLLAFGRRQVMDMKGVDLVDLVRSMFGMIRPVIPENIHIDFVMPEHPIAVTADPGQLEQVLMNLIINARDAMGDGGRLTIAVELETVEADDPRLHVSDNLEPGLFSSVEIVDTGTGMTADVRQHIFEPFYSTKSKEKGTGLGLAVVFGIIRQHRGFIEVRTNEGEGTAVKFYIPADSEVVEQELESHESVSEIRGNETILVVEDEESVRTLARVILEKAGYSVLDAPDGHEGLRILEAHSGTISLILLDVIMPRMGGPEMFTRLRAAGHQMPVLFSSGYAAEGVHTDFVLNEGIELLQKPYGARVLLARVRLSLDQN